MIIVNILYIETGILHDNKSPLLLTWFNFNPSKDK